MTKIREIAQVLGLAERLEELQFLATDFKRIDLEGLARFEDELQIFDRETHILIKSAWEEKLAKNPHMFPGPLASIMDFKEENGILKFRLQRSRFDIYDGLRPKVPAKLDLNQKPLDRDFALPLSMGAVTITAPDKQNPEGCIIFGVRSKSAAFGIGQATTLPAGFYNPDSDRLVMGDPALHRWLMSIIFTTVKELQEEVGFQEFKTLEYLGLIHDGVLAKQPLVALRLMLDLTAVEVKEIAHDVGFEVENYHFVPNNIPMIKGFISRYSLTPHTVGKLVLHFAL